jgi:hypothetical protein
MNYETDDGDIPDFASVAVCNAACLRGNGSEILLDYVAASGCQFYCNGSWHDSKMAQSHQTNNKQLN